MVAGLRGGGGDMNLFAEARLVEDTLEMRLVENYTQKPKSLAVLSIPAILGIRLNAFSAVVRIRPIEDYAKAYHPGHRRIS